MEVNNRIGCRECEKNLISRIARASRDIVIKILRNDTVNNSLIMNSERNVMNVFTYIVVIRVI